MALKSNIGKIRAGLKGAAGRGVERAAGFVADLAQQLAPVDTGELRQSIQVEPGESETQRTVTAGRGLPDIRAAAQEYGTNTQPAQPYMTPAARAIKPETEVASELRDLYRSNGI